MNWQESICQLLQQSDSTPPRGMSDQGDCPTSSTSLTQKMADLLVVDNAKAHRSISDSQSTMEDTQVSSAESSLGEEGLTSLLGEIDIYGDAESDDEEETDMYNLHHSFPVSQSRQTRHRQRRRSRRKRSAGCAHGVVRAATATNTLTSTAASTAATTNDEKTPPLSTSWGSNSDSLIDYDYNSLDAMLHEEDSPEARLNVFQPERRSSIECNFILDQDEETTKDRHNISKKQY